MHCTIYYIQRIYYTSSFYFKIIIKLAFLTKPLQAVYLLRLLIFGISSTIFLSLPFPLSLFLLSFSILSTPNSPTSFDPLSRRISSTLVFILSTPVQFSIECFNASIFLPQILHILSCSILRYLFPATTFPHPALVTMSSLFLFFFSFKCYGTWHIVRIYAIYYISIL